MKVRFISFGCSRNQADTELMMGLVKKAGHELVDDGAEVTVVNTCFVKQDTERKILGLLHSLKGRVIVTGCLAQARPNLVEAFPNFSFLGIGRIERVLEAINTQVLDLSAGSPDYCAERVLANPLIGIIPISEGCLGSCSYCCTKQARGSLKSRSVDDILKQARLDLSRGVREIWLTAQDTGCYGFDIDSSLPILINALTSLEGDFRVRVGMANPQHVIKILPELIASFKSSKVYKFLHLPIQSGSDKVLRDMNRHYTVSDFKLIVGEFRKSFPSITISTDIICGYPTEGPDEWRETMQLVGNVRLGVINISRFFARPGTVAALLRSHPSRILKDRSRELALLHNEICLEDNKSWVGKDCRVLVTEKGAGRNESYINVLLKEKTQSSFLNVRITDSLSHGLIGKII